MRWERLFEDLEAEADEESRAERSAEVADRVWREVGRQQLTDRLRAAVGEHITVRLAGGDSIRGAVVAAGTGWFLVDEPTGSQVLVPMQHVNAVTGLSHRAAVPGSEGMVAARLGLGYVLRGISREQARVVVTMVDGATLAGTITRVGADFLDVADSVHDSQPFEAAVRAPTTVPFGAVVTIRRG